MEPEAGRGLGAGPQQTPLARGGSPLKRDLADRTHPEGPQKVISRPGRRSLTRLPQWGRFVLGPCNLFLGTAPQCRPWRGLGPAPPPGVSAGRWVPTATFQPPPPALEYGGPLRLRGRPSPGMERGGSERGALPLPEVAASRHHIWKAELPGLWHRKARGQRSSTGPGVGPPLVMRRLDKSLSHSDSL